MTTLNDLVGAYIASREWDRATLGRLEFWQQQLGPFDIEHITEDQVDHAITNLVKRSCLRTVGGKVYLWVANCYFTYDIKELVGAAFRKQYYARSTSEISFPYFLSFCPR
jgi:hypothetical protein